MVTRQQQQKRDLIVGLDIGTSKVAALIGEVVGNNILKIIGVGSHPSRGLKRGVIVNIESTVQSIQRAVEDAERMAGCQVYSAFTGIAGSHIRSLNSHGVVAIRDREVTQADVQRVIDVAGAVAIPTDQKILHILPQEFIIDHQHAIREPIGMSGVRLETRVHIVTGAVSATQNIIKCIKSCGLAVNDMVLEQFASSHAVLSDDEKELGVCVVDIGGGTTDVAVFVNGAIRHTAIIPIAGDQVTNDIAIALRTPVKNAEAIKIAHACASHDLSDPRQMISLFDASDRPNREISQRSLSDVVAPRYEELFSLVLDEITRAGLANAIPAGFVLTGGGSKIKGGVDVAERIFQTPTRLGVPQFVTGLEDVVKNPVYATGIGLLLYGQQQYNRRSEELKVGFKNVWSRMRNWFKGNF